MNKKVTLFDLADAVGVSTGTVHRALHDNPGINPETRNRVLEAAKSLGYRPNLAARFLVSKRNLKISVNTLRGTTSFWEDVRLGISDEIKSLPIENVELVYRTFPSLTEGDDAAMEEAFAGGVDGMIIFPTNIDKMRAHIARATQLQIPIVCVVTDAPESERLAVVSTDTLASGALAADLMGRWLGGNGKVAVTLSDFGISEHADKCRTFEETMGALYPRVRLARQIEDHDVETEAYNKCLRLFDEHPDLAGMYITTEASMPVIRAARDAGMLKQLTLITTDLFPELVAEIRSGVVAATIYQRPRTQGRMAFRALYEYLMDDQHPSPHITLAPHLVMRGNLEFFLQKQSHDAPDRELNLEKTLQELAR